MTPPPITDLLELKSYLEISPDDTEEDKKLFFLIDLATNWIEELLDRSLFLKERTEYYSGTGTQQLLLNCRPIIDPTSVVVVTNQTGYYGSNPNTSGETALEYGGNNGFAVKLDGNDNDGNPISKCGILIRIGQYWEKPQVRTWGLLSPFLGNGFGNIKVTYTAGYTIDSMPALLRGACNFLVARLRYILPVGFELSGDSYEEKNYSFASSQKQYLIGQVWPMLQNFRNWNFGRGLG